MSSRSLEGNPIVGRLHADSIGLLKSWKTSRDTAGPGVEAYSRMGRKAPIVSDSEKLADIPESYQDFPLYFPKDNEPEDKTVVPCSTNLADWQAFRGPGATKEEVEQVLLGQLEDVDEYFQTHISFSRTLNTPMYQSAVEEPEVETDMTDRDLAGALLYKGIYPQPFQPVNQEALQRVGKRLTDGGVMTEEQVLSKVQKMTTRRRKSVLSGSAVSSGRFKMAYLTSAKTITVRLEAPERETETTEDSCRYLVQSAVRSPAGSRKRKLKESVENATYNGVPLKRRIVEGSGGYTNLCRMALDTPDNGQLPMGRFSFTSEGTVRLVRKGHLNLFIGRERLVGKWQLGQQSCFVDLDRETTEEEGKTMIHSLLLSKDAELFTLAIRNCLIFDVMYFCRHSAATEGKTKTKSFEIWNKMSEERRDNVLKDAFGPPARRGLQTDGTIGPSGVAKVHFGIVNLPNKKFGQMRMEQNLTIRDKSGRVVFRPYDETLRPLIPPPGLLLTAPPDDEMFTVLIRATELFLSTPRGGLEKMVRGLSFPMVRASYRQSKSRGMTLWMEECWSIAPRMRALLDISSEDAYGAYMSSRVAPTTKGLLLWWACLCITDDVENYTPYEHITYEIGPTTIHPFAGASNITVDSIANEANVWGRRIRPIMKKDGNLLLRKAAWSDQCLPQMTMQEAEETTLTGPVQVNDPEGAIVVVPTANTKRKFRETLEAQSAYRKRICPADWQQPRAVAEEGYTEEDAEWDAEHEGETDDPLWDDFEMGLTDIL